MDVFERAPSFFWLRYGFLSANTITCTQDKFPFEICKARKKKNSISVKISKMSEHNFSQFGFSGIGLLRLSTKWNNVRCGHSNTSKRNFYDCCRHFHIRFLLSSSMRTFFIRSALRLNSFYCRHFNN